MPRATEGAKRRYLLLGLLNAVLADNGYARRDRGGYLRRRPRLRYGNQRNVFGRAAGAGRGGGDAFPDPGDVRGDTACQLVGRFIPRSFLSGQTTRACFRIPNA